MTDKNGNYITGLRPEDFLIKEDGITEKLAAFAQGDEASTQCINGPMTIENTTDHSADNSTDHATDQPPTFSSLVAGSDVFVLFDTSNYMYRDFVFAEDSISEFIHSLESADKIAFYSYSRDLSRAVPLTSHRLQVLRGVRSTVAGDSAALYNALLLTIRDAAEHTGRRMIVVFSNGPDNAT